jgi:AraC-like DNA-binding protein
MIYKNFLPSPPLREFVRNYTIIDLQFGADVSGPFKQRSPKAEQKIVFYIKSPPTIHNHTTSKEQTPPAVAIYSHQCDKISIRMQSGFSAFIIFLQPGVLHRLTRLPMLELLHEYADATLFFGNDVQIVNEQLAAATNHSSMVYIAEQFLLKRCQRLPMKSSIDTIALNLLTDPTCFSLQKIAREAFLSTKQFSRRFTERIGISPKLFSRLSRFNHAYHYKIDHPGVSWTSVANAFYYTDYHHMEKEFKEFTSLTPGEWTKTHLSAPERILKLR